ncbi:MAG: hypothetical protein QME96_16395, partial [Myxococcota bacterium]|nr:hypothetical protein [Myxococcota bacterium]
MMRMRLPATVAAVVQAIPLAAAAQPAAPPPSDSTFGVQLFQPAPGPDNFLNVESTRIGSEFFITAGAIFHYQHRPLSIFDCEPGTGGEGEPACKLEDDPRVVVIDHQVSADLLFSVGFLKLFSVGLAVPITMWQTGNQFDIDAGTATGEDLPAAFALGDLRLHLKLRLYPFMEGDREGFGIALSPVVSFPIGSLFDDIPAAEDGRSRSGSFLGDGFITATARVSADYYHYPFHAAAQVGYHWREDSQLYSTALGHEMVFGGAFGWWIIPDLQVLVEAYGRNGFTNEIDETPIEVDGAIRYRLGPVLLTAGGGAGIVKAIGSPVARGFLGVSFQPFEDVEVENPDRDGDGYLNDVDGCPDDAEDFDEFQDDDGCPELDNDGDTVPDAFDACVMVPEDLDGFKDEDGCPDFD